MEEKRISIGEIGSIGNKIRQPSEIVQEKSALEKVNYNVGNQGYPDNAKTFEREVDDQKPKMKEAFQNEMRQMSLSDVKPDKYVYEYLNEFRREHGLVGTEFSKATKKWFVDHPPILVYIQGWRDHKRYVKVAAGKKGGLKGKGGRPRKYKTDKERKEAHKLAMRALAKKAKEEEI